MFGRRRALKGGTPAAPFPKARPCGAFALRRELSGLPGGERGRRGAYGLLGKAHAFPNRHQAFGTSSRSGMVKVTVVPSPGTLSRS